MTELDKRYDPKGVEDRIYARWEEAGPFGTDPDRADRPTFTVVIPPPNVTGALHMGHALNNTIQDVLIRWHRMRGEDALWVPGTDHAGIATQNVVEKRLAEEGTDRHTLGREAFVERVWAWKEQSGNRILDQLKRLGASCDWSRTRFTLDEGLSRAVREVFVRLYEKGLVYRGRYLIHWCPRCRTALSDEEVERKESKGKLWRIRYPVEGGGDLVVATTRPETMLGDTGVAVHPEDDRYRALVGRTVLLPLVNRSIPIVADGFVDREFGSGAVKVTPAHDPNDFEMGRRHDLRQIDVMNDDGTMSDAAGAYAGLDRFACRKKVVADLEAAGLLEGVDEHDHAVGRCQRCDTVVEPRISTQWFVRMKPLAGPAIEAVRDGRIRFVPERWTKVYYDWMENIRDWCISRQLWWGHRIPAWHCAACRSKGGDDKAGVVVSREDPVACPDCGGGLERDPDVLDTWFSSWLWPFSTLGWPEETDDLARYYPTDVLVTGPDIIFFWVARMIVAGLEFRGEIPFHTVYLHGIVRDDKGRKMSKSLGNAIDPIELIDTYGADALRFSLLILTAQGQDVNLSAEKAVQGRNFANKIWNAARLVLGHVAGKEVPPVPEDAVSLPPEDRWILSRTAVAESRMDEALGAYRFNDAALAIYDFAWEDFCSTYLEMAKGRLSDGEPGARAVAVWVLDRILRLLHPMMPFFTEALWERLRELPGSDREGMLVTAAWPQDGFRDPAIEEEMDRVLEVLRAVRNMRSEFRVEERKGIPFVYVSVEEEAAGRGLADLLNRYRRLALVDRFEIAVRIDRPEGSASAVLPFGTVYVPLVGLVDPAVERERIEKLRKDLAGRLDGVRRKLGSDNFVERAPTDVVERHREIERDLDLQLRRVREQLDALGGGESAAG